LALADLRRLDLAEPRRERVLVECLSEPTRNFVPDPFRSQLDWLVHPGVTLLARPERSASIATSLPRLNALSGDITQEKKRAICRAFQNTPHPFPHLWIRVWTGDTSGRGLAPTAASRSPDRHVLLWTSDPEALV